MKINSIVIIQLSLLALLLGALSCAFISAPAVSMHILEDTEIDEASGLAASRQTPGLLYTHNDSGGEPIVYVLNDKAMLAARILLEGVKNHDWEDIAVGPDPGSGKSCVFVGDIGDNGSKRKTVYVYRFAEPAFRDTLIKVSPDQIKIEYEDGARDAEALFVDPGTGDIGIISKREEQVGFYRVKYPYSLSETNIAKKEATLPMTFVVAADISPNGKQILVKTYTAVFRYKRGKGKSLAQAFAAKAKELPYRIEPQGEAVAWDARGKGYFTLSECSNGKPATLYYYK